MEEGLYYWFSYAAAPDRPGSGGFFVGWTAFGWLIFADDEGQVTFHNPALLATLRPDSWDPERTSA
jgi:hypothetical protein